MPQRKFRRHASKSKKPAAPLPAKPEGANAPTDGSLMPMLGGEAFPAVTFVGRPNVGKSSLFNAILKREIAITDSRPGTTRDSILHPMEIDGKPFDLVDTGGIGGEASDGGGEGALPADMVKMQIDAAVEVSDILAFVVNAQEGLVPGDQEIASRLRKLNRPILLIVNKTEGKKEKVSASEFSKLGFGEPVLTSAIHRQGIEELKSSLAELLPAPEETSDPSGWESIPQIAIVGRRNVGKSSFINRLVGKRRTLVSNVAGTTRDAVDVVVEKNGERFCLIDTAGIRRVKQSKGPVDFFAQVRTERAVRRADIVVLILDSQEGIGELDLKTVDLIVKQFKPCVLLINKWDLPHDDKSAEDYGNELIHRLPNLRGSPVCFISAKNGTRCDRAVEHILRQYKLANTEVPTPALNNAVEKAEEDHEPAVHKTRKPRLLYGVQVGANPPTFVIYCRHAKYITGQYQRYLNRKLGELLGLTGIPLRIVLREASR